MASIYDFSMTTLSGEQIELTQFRGKVLLIVNTASKCGFTPQYEGLQKLHDIYQEQGLVILGFPCDQFGHQEPGDSEEIGAFCQSNYGVSFTMSEKVEVNGAQAAPLYEYLKSSQPGILGSEAIKWNFTKFLVGRSGEIIDRYAPTTKPEALVKDIETALDAVA